VLGGALGAVIVYGVNAAQNASMACKSCPFSWSVTGPRGRARRARFYGLGRFPPEPALGSAWVEWTYRKPWLTVHALRRTADEFKNDPRNPNAKNAH
jgi:hypothetical protein